MISASVVVDGHGHGHGAPGGGMALMEPFLLGGSKPEFLRPLPKPAARYNGAALNGVRPPRKFKEEDECAYRALYQAPAPAPPPPPPPPSAYHYPGGPYGALYPGHYTPLLPPYSRKQRLLARPAAPRRHDANFTRGSLIQLASGELRRVEDMRTEDFVTSAEQSPALRLDPSTVLRVHEGPAGAVTLTLSYGEHHTQVEFESSTERPFFVLGRGWASCSPERTLHCYGLRCQRLQVGDVCISLTPRHARTNEHSNPRKRRWSAPDQFCNDDEAPPSTSRTKV